MGLSSDVELDVLSDHFHGYVGTGIEAICTEAVLCCNDLINIMDVAWFQGKDNDKQTIVSVDQESLSRRNEVLW